MEGGRWVLFWVGRRFERGVLHRILIRPSPPLETQNREIEWKKLRSLCVLGYFLCGWKERLESKRKGMSKNKRRASLLLHLQMENISTWCLLFFFFFPLTLSPSLSLSGEFFLCPVRRIYVSYIGLSHSTLTLSFPPRSMAFLISVQRNVFFVLPPSMIEIKTYSRFLRE